MAMFEILSAGLSDIGRKRQSNQDNFLLDDRHQLYLVADGMGGHQAGEVASQLVVDSIRQFYLAKPPAPNAAEDTRHDPSLSPEANRLEEAIRYANQQIYQASATHKGFKGMGSTLAVVQFVDNTFIAANVGDSPIYLIHEDAIETLSVPHTLMAEQATISPLDPGVFGSELQHMLTRGMGVEDTVKPDIWESPCFSGDRLVICSDGLSGKVTPAEILDVAVTQNAPDACRTLVALANQRGGEDNITVVVLQVNKQNSLLQRLNRWKARFTGGDLSED
jgi:serine/threonine protein phosphatase PrpC